MRPLKKWQKALMKGRLQGEDPLFAQYRILIEECKKEMSKYTHPPRFDWKEPAPEKLREHQLFMNLMKGLYV